MSGRRNKSIMSLQKYGSVQLAVSALQKLLFLDFFMFLLIRKWKKTYLGQNLAIFSHFVAHDGSKIAPIPQILVQKIFMLPIFIIETWQSPNFN